MDSLFPRNPLARHALPRLAQLALDVVDGHVSRAERHGRQGELLLVAVYECEHGCFFLLCSRVFAGRLDLWGFGTLLLLRLRFV